MDDQNFEDNDNNDYVSDSCSESSQSDFDIESDHSEMSDIKANPLKWTDNIQSITVPPPNSKGGLKLPSAFPDTSPAVDYFQLFFTDSLISDIVKFTNQYAQIEIHKKRE